MLLLVRKFAKDKSAVVGLGVILFAIFVVSFAEHLAPFPQDAYESHIMQRLKPPSWEFPFGTDGLGRDMVSRVILGTRTALGVALAVVGLSILIGVPLGMLAGYFGLWIGEVVMRVTDVFLAVPQLILAIALAQMLDPGVQTAIIALSLTYWPFFARTAYAETRRLKSMVFIEALEAVGASPTRIMFLHILPNSASSIIVRATLGMGFIILIAAVLGFLGIGAPPPQPGWGEAIAASRQHLPFGWWLTTFPGLAIFAAVLGFNLLGDGLRDILDPRLRRSR